MKPSYRPPRESITPCALQTQNPTKPYPGLHEGTLGYMPASYTVDYGFMAIVALTFAIFDAVTLNKETSMSVPSRELRNHHSRAVLILGGPHRRV